MKITTLLSSAILSTSLATGVWADEKLTLDIDLVNDSLSMSHNIENFFFQPTINTNPGSKLNINQMGFDPLRDHLVATALVRVDGQVVGVATETEIVYIAEGDVKANSLWSIRLNAPGLTGFLAVEQWEDANEGAALQMAVFADPDKDWADEWLMVPTSVEGTVTHFASGDLSAFQGGRFQEYNGTNQADLKNFGAFRGRISIDLYPAE